VIDSLSLLGWRRAVEELYADVRHAATPAEGHTRWRAGRDVLFRKHPSSPLPIGDPLRETGLPYWPYDPELRYEVSINAAHREERRSVDTATDGRIKMRLVGTITLVDLGISLDVWWLEQYAGGVFLPLRDGTAGTDTYGGGRYLLDTAKGADLGGGRVGAADRLVVDLNFLYHPSCRYDAAWECPLAPEGNTTRLPLRAGERLQHG
jgi:uncharacterized protein